MYEAARLTDPIAHTSALAGFLVGAIIGIALIAAVAFATLTCGFGVALIAGLAAGLGATAILGIGEAIGKSHSSPAGVITSGSRNVFTNSLAAAYATVSTVLCDKHSPVPLVAEGSSNVFINSLPAARKKDAINCGATIDDGSSNVFIGGGTVTYIPVADEVPAELRVAVDWAFTLAGLGGGLAGVIKKAGTGLTRALTPCVGKFLAGFVVGEAVGRYVAAPVISRVIGGLSGNPVDVTSGRKVLLAEYEVDFLVRSPIPLAGSRFYGSNLTYEGTLGKGWVLPWELRLQQRDGQIWFSDAQGRETGYPLVQPGQNAFSEAEQRYLACTPQGQYIVYDLNEVYLDFGHLDITGAEVAHVLRREDRSGQWHSYDRDEHDRVRTIRTSGGQQLRLHYATPHSRLQEIECTHGGTPGALVKYGYDALGQLVSVTDANGTLARAFSYADGLMASHATALGFTCSYEWALIAGLPRVVSCRTSAGEHTSFRYDPALRQTWAEDEQGRTAHWLYDEHAQIIACTDLDGASYRIVYNEAGMPALLDLPGDRRVAFDYDAAARIVGETDPLGRVTQTSYDGNSFRISQLVLPDGGRWRAEYDFLGRLLTRTDPLGRQEHYEYASGLSPLPLAHIDARGGRQQMAWDRRGQLAAYTDCSGKVTRYSYNADGALASVTDALGQVTRFERLRTGQPTSIVMADGSTETFEYDAAGLAIKQRNSAQQTRRWVRNARGQVTDAIDAAQRHLRYRYDVRGRLVELASDDATRYRFGYDAGDRLAHEQRPDGVERHLHYDPAGALVEHLKIGFDQEARTAGPQRKTVFARDKMGRLLARQTDTALSVLAWDAGDRLTGAGQTPVGEGLELGLQAGQVRFEYDQAGRLRAEHGSEGAVQYTFDELDNLTDLRLPHEQQIGLLSYGSGHVHQIRSADRVISDFERDDLHREILHTQGGLTQRIGYDVLGRRSWQAAGAANAALAPGQGRYWRNYRYTLSGELAEQRDSVRGAISFQYDPAGYLLRQTRVTAQVQEQFAWDAAGNLLDGIKRLGQVEGNRLKAWEELRFEYDAWGNLRTKRKGQNQIQRFSYDADDRLVKVVTETAAGVAETRFDYDPLGRRIGTTERRADANALAGVERKRFVWQGLRMVQEIRERGVSSYVYSPDAAYVPLARIDVGITDGAAAASTPRVFYFHNDAAGTPLEVTDEAGELAWAGRYAAWGKVHDGEDAALLTSIEQPLRFPGQYEDESTGLHYNTFRFYDPDSGRYITQDPIGLEGGRNLYAYVPNPTGWSDPLGWDWNYHLTDANGNVYYHGRASDNATMADVARRHAANVGTDGSRFGTGDVMTRITEPGTDRIVAQGIEGLAIEETGTIGRRTTNGGNVRGNAIAGVNRATDTAAEKIIQGQLRLNGQSPSQMTGTTLKGGKAC